MIRFLCLTALVLGAAAPAPSQQSRGEVGDVAAPQPEAPAEAATVPVVLGFIGNPQPVPQPDADPEAPQTPQDLKYILREGPLGAYMVRYPRGLGTDMVSDSEFVEFRIEFPNRGLPKIDFQIERLPKGRGYRYSYRLANLAGAPRPIWSWKIVAPAKDDSLVLDHPPHWYATSPQSLATRPAVASQAALLGGAGSRRSGALGKYAGWTAKAEGTRIQAGGSLSAFTAVSRFRPGWTTAYVSAGSGLRLPGSSADLPAAVNKEIDVLRKRENSRSVVLTVGPRYGPQAERSQIAAEWLLGLEKTIAGGELDANSRYLAELIEALERIAQGESEMPLPTASAPAEGLEARLDGIIRMAL